MVRACGAGSPTECPTLLLALFRALRDPKDNGHVIGTGGEDTDGDWRHSGGQQERRFQRCEGARSDHENNLLLGGRVLGHVRLYEESGGGGEAER